LCGNPSVQQRIDQAHDQLDSLNYVSPQSNLQNNLALLRIQDSLQDPNTKQCGAPSTPGVCAID
jgi:hypothetical protein